ncbi:MAG: CPBP family intramembrane glutamic endopeptidase [Pirellulaceae bacterium]
MTNPYEASQDATPPAVEPLAFGQTSHSDQDVRRSKLRIWPLFPLTIAELLLASLLQVVVIVFILLFGREAGSTIKEAAMTLPTRMYEAPIFISLLACSGMSMIIGGFLFGRISAKNQRCLLSDRLGLQWPTMPILSWMTLLLGSIPVLLVAVGAVILVEKVIPGDETVLELYRNISTPWAIVFIIAIGVLPGFGEELFFRGFLQRRFLQRLRPTAAIGITSVIFGLAHVTPHGIVLATIIGVWLGIIAYRTNSIWPGAFIHAFINSGWNVYQVGRFQWGFPTIPPLWFSVIGGVITLAAFLYAAKIIASRRIPDASSGIDIQQWPRLMPHDAASSVG